MIKKTIGLIILILVLLIPNNIFAEEIKSIIILVDELPIETIKELSLDNYCLGYVNLKTRSPQDEEELFLTINTGRKLGPKGFKKLDKNLTYIGDLLTTSSIGANKEVLLIAGRERRVSFKEDDIVYEYNWLVKKTDKLLDKSDVLLINYEIQNITSRINILNKYLDNYNDYHIIILPTRVAEKDKKLLNNYLVPLLCINGDNKGLLTSQSTKRKGFIALEDISVELKNTYGYINNIDVGNRFDVVKENELMNEFEDIYLETINLLIIAYIYHGLIYFSQALLGLWILGHKECEKISFFIYAFLSTSILISLILGLFKIHRNINIYLIINFSISYLITSFILKRKLDIIKILSVSTYSVIAIGICFYPKLIYNSYIGFNNLIYGARYYGLNNGIMGVLLINSILLYYSFSKNKNLYKLFGLLIFSLNILVLSANLGANTGGFITSVILFGLIIYTYYIPKINNKKIVLFLFLGGIILFIINMIFDNIIGEKTHALGLIYRIKANGIDELMTIVFYKFKELLRLTFLPPFPIVVVLQILMLIKLNKNIKGNIQYKRQFMVAIITSLVGFILNDTGVITFIYMIHYLILNIIEKNVKVLYNIRDSK